MIMDALPLHLFEEILLKLDPKSLAMMQCTKRSIKSHISNNPYFKPEYLSRIGSGLLHISSFGSNHLFFHSSGADDSRSTRNKVFLTIPSQILGSCSGLLLLCVDGLCVANPITNRFRFLDHSEPKLKNLRGRNKQYKVNLDQKNRVGFAVDQLDRVTQSFKIVCLIELTSLNLDVTTYRFEINSGDSFRLSETTITCLSSNLVLNMKPVYFDGDLHWLRNDGSIVVFNPKTEEARLILTESPQNLSSKILFTASDDGLTLISEATAKVIYVYALEDILTDPKWVLVRRIENRVIDEKRMECLDVTAYDGKSLVVRDGFDGVVHRFDLRANEWKVIGGECCEAAHDYYLFKPSLCSVVGLEHDDDHEVVMGHINYDSRRFSCLSVIMRLIKENSPSALNLLKKKTHLGKRLIEEETELLRLKMEGLNKRRRL